MSRAEERKRKYEANKQSQADMKHRQEEEQERMVQGRPHWLHGREQNAIKKLAQEYEQAAFIKSDSQEDIGDDDEDIDFYFDDIDESEADRVTKAKQ